MYYNGKLGTYLLRGDIKGDSSDINFCIRVNARDDEKKTCKLYIILITL